MEKDFDKWNIKKKEINNLERRGGFYFKEREIWWCSLGINIGYEQDGKNELFERPVLILKIFNKEVLLIVPLTSQDKSGKYYYQFDYEGDKFSIVLSQIRLISSKRLLRKIRTFEKSNFKEVRNLIIKFL